MEGQSNHLLRKKRLIGKHKCCSEIVTLIRSLDGLIKLTIESRSVELRNGDRIWGSWDNGYSIPPYGINYREMDSAWSTTRITLLARATTRGCGDGEAPAKEARKDQLLREERDKREKCTQGKVFQECG